MKKGLFLVLTVSLLAACHHPQAKITGVSTEAISVNAMSDDIADQAYLSRLTPLKAELAREMDVKLGFSAERLWVGAPECPMLNWASDALWESAKRLYPEKVDIAIVNMGGMRCEWPQGDITRSHVFELMPFDNRLVVLKLKGSDVLELCQSFATYGGQGVAGMRMKAEKGKLKEVKIAGKPVNPKAIYTVATSDYLAGGTDHMEALTKYVDYWASDALIRDLYIEAVKKQDTLRAVVDGRMNVK